MKLTEKQKAARIEKNWVKFKPSLCAGCWSGCCTMPVQVTSEDLYHMGYITMNQVNGPLVKIARELSKKGVIRSFNVTTRIFGLATKNGSDCVFLDDDRRCTIYERRPHVCRLFPQHSLRVGHCPGQMRS